MKRLLALLLVVVMVFSIAACGGGSDVDTDDPGNDVPGNDSDDPGDDGDDPGDDNDSGSGGDDSGDSGSGIEGEFYSFESDSDDASYVVFNMFKELKYTMTTSNTDGEISSFDFSYALVGRDDELEANHYEITIFENDEEKVFEAWVNDNDELVKAGSNGEYSTGDMAVLPAMGFLFHMIWFTAYSDGYSDAFIEDDFSGYGWNVEEKRTDTQDFGSGNVRVHRYKFTYEWFGEDLSYEWEVAEIGGKNLFTRWKMVIGEDILEMDVERVIPH